MNKILKKLIATCVVVLTCSAAFAEHDTPKKDSNPETTALPLIMPCNKSQIIFDMLGNKKYVETPIAIGNGIIFKPDNMPVPGQLTLWYNKDDKKNFSVVFSIGGTNISCIVVNGANLEFVPGDWMNGI
tara:strand:- start:1309 stop:1695 length:387 start_codon:yes stop_codon:yes gene_type:complete